MWLAPRRTPSWVGCREGEVRLDTPGHSEADIRRLRNARVVDLRTLDGRPLTDEEARKLTARMTAAMPRVSTAMLQGVRVIRAA